MVVGGGGGLDFYRLIDCPCPCPCPCPHLIAHMGVKIWRASVTRSNRCRVAYFFFGNLLGLADTRSKMIFVVCCWLFFFFFFLFVGCWRTDGCGRWGRA